LSIPLTSHLSWTHPIHIHLVDFQIVSRTGTRGVRPYEKASPKLKFKQQICLC
jgi:FtsP/CotA-like multicopper oxidase with cupredoxin domain